jgi:hypothetical protein
MMFGILTRRFPAADIVADPVLWSPNRLLST